MPNSSASKFPHTLSPVLHFRGRDVANSTWHVSCLLVTRDQSPGALWYQVSFGQVTLVFPEILASWAGYNFFQYSMPCRISAAPYSVVDYSFADSQRLGLRAYRFHVPGIDPSAEANMLFFSCNGVQIEKDRKELVDYTKCWRDALTRHREESPVHVAFCGGDFVYCDTVLELPIILEWNKLPARQRFSAPFTREMQSAVMHEYFERYMYSLTELPEMAEFLSCVPMSSVPDDHDYFDGKGSHSADYNHSPVYQGIAQSSKFFVALFQCGASPFTIATKKPRGMYGNASFSQVHVVSRRTVVLIVDHRSERMIDFASPKNSILMQEESEARLFAALEQQIPLGCKHLIVSVFGPIAYPDTTAWETVADVFNCIQADGCMPAVKSLLGNPPDLLGPQHVLDLQDDIFDEFGSRYYSTARNKFLTRLHAIATAKHLRVTFVCGDVHLGGFGFMYSQKPDPSDPSYCRQWITSPMLNMPCPDSLSDFINQSAKKTSIKRFLKTLKLRRDKPDVKKMYYHDPLSSNSEPKILYYSGMDNSIMGRSRAVVNKRNYLLVRETRTDGLTGRLIVERDYAVAGTDMEVFTDHVAAPPAGMASSSPYVHRPKLLAFVPANRIHIGDSAGVMSQSRMPGSYNSPAWHWQYAC
jgi:hypothetical protein